MTTEGGLLGVVVVEVHLIGVHGQQREPGIVGFGDRASEGVLVDLAFGKVFEVATLPTRGDGHGWTDSFGSASTPFSKPQTYTQGNYWCPLFLILPIIRRIVNG